MSRPSFRETVKSICPPWLLGPVGEGIGYACTIVLDAMAESVRMGVKASMPQGGVPSSLGILGDELGIDRGANETEAHYAERLTGSLQAKRRKGSAGELLRQLLGQFSPDTTVGISTVSDRSVWHSIDAVTGVVTKTVVTPRNWVWDAYATGVLSPPRWKRLWVIIENTQWASDVWTFGDNYDEIGTWGSTATVAEVSAVRRTVERWRSRGVHVVNTIVCFTPGILASGNAPGSPMPDQDFDDPAVRVTLDACFWKGCPR